MGLMDHPPAGQAAGRRGRNRLRARLAAKIVTLDGTRNTILLDLSQTGARLNASPGMIPGQKAVLTWIGFEAFGSIVWVDNGRCGMVFDEPLSHGVVLATRDVDARDHLPSDHELERWRAREWVAGMRRI